MVAHMKGPDNPNYKGALKTHICGICNKEYQTYVPKQKFCSLKCLGVSRRRPHKPGPERNCKLCGKVFHGYKDRIYCSRKCAWRGSAKEAVKVGKKKWSFWLNEKRVCKDCGISISHKSRYAYCCDICALRNQVRGGKKTTIRNMIYGKRKDNNHNEIASALREAGAFVKDMSMVGHGAPDMVVWTGSAWEFIEIKNPKTQYGRKGFNKHQLKWQEEMSGIKVYLIRSIEEALAWWKEVHTESKPPLIHTVSNLEDALNVVSENGKYLHPNGKTTQEILEGIET